MPHQCVRCNKFYDDGSQAVLSGCSCGAKLFFFIKQSKIDESRNVVANLSGDEKKQIEVDVFDLVGANVDEGPVILDFESIRILKPGKYELDLANLFKNESLVYKLDEGKYMIDLVRSFQRKFKE